LPTGVFTLELLQFINGDMAVYDVAVSTGTALLRGRLVVADVAYLPWASASEEASLERGPQCGH
jgi:hypothetical protein